MAAFEYIALDTQGRERKGVLEGDTPRQVRAQLREKQLTPMEVNPVAQREAGEGARRRQFSMRRGISATDLALVTRQLATLVRSGTPLEESLRAVSQQTEKARLSNMMLAVRSRVMEGHSLAKALGEFPHVFPELYRATVGAGEHSGHLDVVLERLADYTENRQQMRSKIQMALFYPLLLTIMALGVASLLLVYVVPQVVQVFDNIGQQLPLLTRILIAISDFFQHYGLYLLGALVLAGFGAGYLFRQAGPRKQLHRFMLSVPLLSRLVKGINTARFARTLSILTASGVPVLEGLRISAEVMVNLPMKEAVEDAARKVREGSSIQSALAKSGYFPPMTLHLISSGESSGQLEEMLERAATSQEREVETLIATLMALFEPLLIVVMGLMVLVIVLAILMPIFELNQLVQ